MKKLYSTILVLATMVAALSLTACGGDDKDDEIDGGVYYDDNEYFEISINGENYTDKTWCGSVVINLGQKRKNGMDVYAYGGVTDLIPITYQDGLQYHIVAGYISEDLKTIIPNSEGTYEVISNRGEYFVTDYSDRVGMVISGGNMRYRTVTSGSLKITKVTKLKDPYLEKTIGRDYTYATEGTFDFVLTDDRNGNEFEINGRFRVIF